MKKTLLALGFLFLSPILLILAGGGGTKIQMANESFFTPNEQEERAWSILEKVVDGKNILKNSPPLEFVEKKGGLIKKQISLAIIDIESGEISEKRYWLEIKDINKAGYLMKNYLPNPNNYPRFSPVDPNEDFEVTNNRWNSWASDWSVENIALGKSDIYAVVAVKYMLPTASLIYPEDKTGSKYSDIIFSPPSDALYDPDVIARGIEFLNNSTDLAFSRLKEYGVMSKSYPEKLVVDAISPTFVKNILINEQTDPHMLLNLAQTDEEKRRIAEKVLLRYGLNEEKSYRYTVSKAGALGPAQIMASTYSYRKKDRRGNWILGIVQSYPEASLIKDINLGRVDMINAIMAQILVFDDHWAKVKERVKSSGSRAQRVFDNLAEKQIQEGMAMIYNGGPSKYNLSTGGLNLKSRGSKETFSFLKKLRVIKTLNLFEN